MLKKVLEEIYKGKIFSASLISKKLNISEALVEEAVSQLTRMGYIMEDYGSPTCETKCSGCFVTSCNTIPLRTLSVTERGQKLLQNI